jgi:hypothetical protein
MPNEGVKEQLHESQNADDFANGIWDFCSGKTKADVTKEYGILSRVMQRRKHDIKNHFGHGCMSNDEFVAWCRDNETDVRKAIDKNFGKKNRGRKPFLTDTEVNSIKQIARHFDELGMSIDEDGLKKLVRDALVKKGERLLSSATTDEERDKATLYLESKVTNQYMHSNFGSKRIGSVLEKEHRKKLSPEVHNDSQKCTGTSSSIIASNREKKK